MRKQPLAVVLALLVGLVYATAQGTLEFSVDLVEPNTDYPSEAVLALTDQLLVRPQGTLEFSAYLSGLNTDYTGQGTFILTDQLLTYAVSTPIGFSLGEIRGPGPARDAPIILQLGFQIDSFDLGHAFCIAPGGGDPGRCDFRGTKTITESQVAELVSEQWYVWAHSPPAPSFPISGQIVPEPSLTALFFIGLLAIGVAMFLRAPKEVYASQSPRDTPPVEQ